MTIFDHPRPLVRVPAASRSFVGARGQVARGARTIGRLHWWREVLLLGALYEVYELCRRFTPSHPGVASAHARGVISLERKLHIDVERPLNQLLVHHGWLAVGAGYYYALAHFVVTVAVLVWVYVRRPSLYRSVRTVLVLASVAAIVIFWLYPVAPPRLAESGLVDTNVLHNIFGVAHAEKSGGFVNIYAAVPSLHAGWAIWVAATMSRAFPGSRLRHLFWLYPLTTILVVIGTANHYLVDVLAGGAVVGLAYVAVIALAHKPGPSRAPIRSFPDRSTLSGAFAMTQRTRRPRGGPRSQARLLGSGPARRTSGNRP